MSSVLVDSNVILDVATNDPQWELWSTRQLERLSERSILVINPLIYAEVSAGFQRVEELEDAVPVDVFRREVLPYEAAFLAGKCFRHYRRQGGARRSPLPDFYIGAHAAVAGHRLLTRDARRYRSYFPKLDLIVP